MDGDTWNIGMSSIPYPTGNPTANYSVQYNIIIDIKWDYINMMWYAIVKTYFNASPNFRNYLIISYDGKIWSGINLAAGIPGYPYANAIQNVFQSRIPLTGETKLFVAYGLETDSIGALVSVDNLIDLNTASLVRNITITTGLSATYRLTTMASNENMILVAYSSYSAASSPLLYASYDGITFTQNKYIRTDGYVGTITFPLQYSTNSGLFNRCNIFVGARNQLQTQVLSFLQLVYLNSIWLASLYSAVSMIYSFDGVNWYPCAGDILTNNPVISSILFNGSNFIAIAYKLGGTTNTYYSSTTIGATVTRTNDGRLIYTSVDGITWSTKLLTDATTGPGAYLISTITASSVILTNGRNDITPYIPQTIQSANTIQNNQSIYNANTFWIMSNNYGTLCSTEYDALVTYRNQAGPVDPKIYALIYDTFYTTYDFTLSSQFTSDGRLCIAYGITDRFNATLNYYYTYTAGNEWYQSTSLQAVIGLNGPRIFAMQWDFTDSYWYAYTNYFVYRAKDGMTWVLYSNINIVSFIIQKITNAAISYLGSPLTIGLDANGKRMIFASYDTKLYYSYDHSVWNLCTGYNNLNTTTHKPKIIVYFNSKWVTSISANNANDSIAYSSDGLTWISVPNTNAIISPTHFATNGSILLAYKPLFQATTNIGVLAYSYDAINWSIANTYSIVLDDLFYSGSCFIGSGKSLTGTTGGIITSVDGIRWVYTSKVNGADIGARSGGGSLFNSRSAMKPGYLSGPGGITLSPKIILDDIQTISAKVIPETKTTNTSTIIYISSPFTNAFNARCPNTFSYFLNISFNVTSTTPSIPIPIFYTLAIGQANNLTTDSTVLYNLAGANASGLTPYNVLSVPNTGGSGSVGVISVKSGNYTRSIILNNIFKNNSPDPWYVYLMMISNSGNGNKITMNNIKISCKVLNRASLA
jgi:hypothetical protein